MRKDANQIIYVFCTRYGDRGGPRDRRSHRGKLMEEQKMYDYMRALQDKFFQIPKFPELEQQMDQIHRELSQQMGKDTRKKLLCLVDSAEELQERISLASFVAGFRLAAGITRELSFEEPYSFAKEEEQQVRDIQHAGQGCQIFNIDCCIKFTVLLS